MSKQQFTLQLSGTENAWVEFDPATDEPYEIVFYSDRNQVRYPFAFAFEISRWLNDFLSNIPEDDENPSCPSCGQTLNMDLEYMQDHYAEAATRMPEEETVWYCDNEDCLLYEDGGTLEDLKTTAAHLP